MVSTQTPAGDVASTTVEFFDDQCRRLDLTFDMRAGTEIQAAALATRGLRACALDARAQLHIFFLNTLSAKQLDLAAVIGDARAVYCTFSSACNIMLLTSTGRVLVIGRCARCADDYAVHQIVQLPSYLAVTNVHTIAGHGQGLVLLSSDSTESVPRFRMHRVTVATSTSSCAVRQLSSDVLRGSATCTAYSRNGMTAVATSDGLVFMHNPQMHSSRLMPLNIAGGRSGMMLTYSRLSFSASSSRLIGVFGGNTVQIWSTEGRFAPCLVSIELGVATVLSSVVFDRGDASLVAIVSALRPTSNACLLRIYPEMANSAPVAMFAGARAHMLATN
jgi:hypothetical protein